MNFSLHQINVTKRFARFILVMFVLSVINLSVQMPAHAAMKMSAQMNQSMNMNMNMNMDHEAMMDCHCPPALCDSVLAVDNQSTDGLQATDMVSARVLVRIIETLDENHGQLNQYQRYTRLQLRAEQAAQPPLQQKTLLLI